LGHGPLLLSSGLLNISRSNHVAVLKRVGRFGSLSVDDEVCDCFMISFINLIYSMDNNYSFN